MKIVKIGSLQIEPEAKQLNQTFLIIQKFSFVLMALILIAAVLGLFGKGLFSTISATDNNLTISYEKFIRKQASTVYRVEIQRPSNSDKSVRFWIEQSFYDKLLIKNINPAPTLEEVSNNRIYYSFNTNDASKINITLVAEPEKAGFNSTYIGLSDEKQIHLTQLIYP